MVPIYTLTLSPSLDSATLTPQEHQQYLATALRQGQ